MKNEKKKKIVIIGTGETAILAYEYFTHDSCYTVFAFSVNSSYIQENNPKLYDLPICPLEQLESLYSPNEYYAFVAISSGQLNRARTNIYNLVKEKGFRCASYVSSRAFVWHNVKIGENCFILEDNTLQPFVEIGNNVTLWSGNHIGHNAKIFDNCFITSHVVVSGFCKIGENSFLGVNSAIADEVTVAKDNFIGMGSIINKDTEENKVYTGNSSEVARVPAKKFCRVRES